MRFEGLDCWIVNDFRVFDGEGYCTLSLDYVGLYNKKNSLKVSFHGNRDDSKILYQQIVKQKQSHILNANYKSNHDSLVTSVVMNTVNSGVYRGPGIICETPTRCTQSQNCSIWYWQS